MCHTLLSPFQALESLLPVWFKKKKAIASNAVDTTETKGSNNATRLATKDFKVSNGWINSCKPLRTKVIPVHTMQ
jgi:hypothetical protein